MKRSSIELTLTPLGRLHLIILVISCQRSLCRGIRQRRLVERKSSWIEDTWTMTPEPQSYEAGILYSVTADIRFMLSSFAHSSSLNILKSLLWDDVFDNIQIDWCDPNEKWPLRLLLWSFGCAQISWTIHIHGFIHPLFSCVQVVTTLPLPSRRRLYHNLTYTGRSICYKKHAFHEFICDKWKLGNHYIFASPITTCLHNDKMIVTYGSNNNTEAWKLLLFL